MLSQGIKTFKHNVIFFFTNFTFWEMSAFRKVQEQYIEHLYTLHL